MEPMSMVFSTISGLEIQLVIGQRMEAYTWSAYNMVKYLLGLLVESHFSHEFLYISHVHVATLSRYDLSLTLLIYTQFILSWFIWATEYMFVPITVTFAILISLV